MSALSLTDFDAGSGAAHIPAQKHKQSAPVTHRQKHTPIIAILAVFILLAGLVSGCAAAPSISVAENANQQAANPEPDAGHSPAPQEPAAEPGLVAPVSDRQEAAPTPEPTATPTFTPTPTPAPTDTPTPTPSPLPTATDTPTPTPTPSPLPTATDTPAPTPSPTAAPTDTPAPLPAAIAASSIRYVVIITIDGMRPDALELADTPTLDGLRAIGAYSPNAQTIIPSFTLPSHVSMFSGVVPQKHGIVEGLPCIGCPLAIGPTLFSVAHDAGLRTALVTGKKKLDYLVLPHSVDEPRCGDVHDPEVKKEALEIIEAGLPNVMFIHFPDTDRVGHAYGWMSENQLYAVSFADGLIGEIVAALKEGNYWNNTLLIVTADHGGHGFKHGDDSPVDRTIPWLAVGPGVPQGVILTSTINTYDTAATAAYALNLDIPERWDGKPVMEIFQ